MKRDDTTPRCRLCHRPLTTPDSVAAGVGPTCVKNERQTDLFDGARGKYLAPKKRGEKTE